MQLTVPENNHIQIHSSLNFSTFKMKPSQIYFPKYLPVNQCIRVNLFKYAHKQDDE